MKILQFLPILLLTLLTSQQCPNNDPYCGKCAFNRCTICYGASLFNGQCQRVTQKVASCRQYSYNGVCSFCSEGYELKNGKCEAIYSVIDCAALEYGKCVMCRHGYLVNNGQCSSTNKCMRNCRLCKRVNGRETCKRCDDRYVLVRNYDGSEGCQMETQMTMNCLIKNGSGMCDVCDVNYYWSNGRCLYSALQKVLNFADPLMSKFLGFFILLLNLK